MSTTTSHCDQSAMPQAQQEQHVALKCLILLVALARKDALVGLDPLQQFVVLPAICTGAPPKCRDGAT
jgi:hypothetical protein